MGIAFSYIRKMEELGLFRQSGVKILDIGSSNLYLAKAEEVTDFVRAHGAPARADLAEFAARMAYGSGYDPVKGGRNEAFAGELFEAAGMHYESFDIANGYRTMVIDLNHAVLPAGLQRKFDLVLNFGTTEHILNQLNCFKIIHDATKVGGYIYHSLPAVGYLDHGYITYTGRCFFDIAGYNDYELVACWFDGPAEGGSVLQSLRSYSAHFPALKKALDGFALTEQGRTLRDLKIPDIAINVVYRKVRDKPFWGALESSTSVGEIPGGVTAAYQGADGQNDINKALTLTTLRIYLRTRMLQPFLRRVAGTLQEYPSAYRFAKRVYRGMTGRG